MKTLIIALLFLLVSCEPEVQTFTIVYQNGTTEKLVQECYATGGECVWLNDAGCVIVYSKSYRCGVKELIRN